MTSDYKHISIFCIHKDHDFIDTLKMSYREQARDPTRDISIIRSVGYLPDEMVEKELESMGFLPDRTKGKRKRQLSGALSRMGGPTYVRQDTTNIVANIDTCAMDRSMGSGNRRFNTVGRNERDSQAIFSQIEFLKEENR